MPRLRFIKEHVASEQNPHRVSWPDVLPSASRANVGGVLQVVEDPASLVLSAEWVAPTVSEIGNETVLIKTTDQTTDLEGSWIGISELSFILQPLAMYHISLWLIYQSEDTPMRIKLGGPGTPGFLFFLAQGHDSAGSYIQAIHDSYSDEFTMENVASKRLLRLEGIVQNGTTEGEFGPSFYLNSWWSSTIGYIHQGSFCSRRRLL